MLMKLIGFRSMWTSVLVHFTLYAFYEFLNARWLLRGNVGLDFVKSTPQKDKKLKYCWHTFSQIRKEVELQYHVWIWKQILFFFGSNGDSWEEHVSISFCLKLPTFPKMWRNNINGSQFIKAFSVIFQKPILYWFKAHLPRVNGVEAPASIASCGNQNSQSFSTHIQRPLASSDTPQIQQNCSIDRIPNSYFLRTAIAYGIEDDQRKHLL